ncbi:SpoIIE family protein phosphatase [Kitasatospora sp. NPDC048540]|uniref:SpoIIE family protein phosphatase n=1 Tax=Kitasatospora sp. NPDC048540 TaxID=3155634 RepID=UPI0033E66AD1
MAHDDPLMVVDAVGTLARWSRRAEELLGYPAGEVLGRPATVLAAEPPSAADGQGRPARAVLRHRDGHHVAVDLRVRPTPAPGGGLAWAVSRIPEGTTAGDGLREALLDALFTRSPVGLHLLDTDLRIVRVNTATRNLRGVPEERMIGRLLIDAYDVEDARALERMLRSVLADGQPVQGLLVRVRPESDPERIRSADVSAFRLEGPDGEVLGAAVTAVDVTEREASRTRVRTLDRVRERVGRTLDTVITCQELADALVPGFADLAVVEVVDAVVRGDEPPLGPLGQDVPLRRAAYQVRAGITDAPAYPVGDVRTLPWPTPYAQSVADLRPRLTSLGPDTPWLAIDPRRAEAIRASGAHSLISAPLVLRGTVLGLLSLYRAELPPFEQQDVDLALDLAAHTALCIDNARRFAREHTIAATLQRRLLPTDSTERATVESAHLHVPGGGGGGWFDTIALPGARTALVVGNVSGSGIHTATTMGELRTVIHTLAAQDLEPDELLARLNDTTVHLAAERAGLPSGDPLHREPLSATCVYAVYDPVTRNCTIASAGQPAPVLVSPDGTTTVTEVSGWPSLGSTDEEPFPIAVVTLADGSVLALYTPALLAAGPAAAGPGALCRVLDDPAAPLQDQCDRALYGLLGGPGQGAAPAGDAILLLARTHAVDPGLVADWLLPADRTAPAIARAHARDRLARWGVDEETGYAAELIVSELVTNAVRYGEPPLSLRLIKDRALSCEVHDAGATAPRLRHARTIDEGGRGLFIAAQLARSWGTRYTADGKTVWTEQPLPPPA